MKLFRRKTGKGTVASADAARAGGDGNHSMLTHRLTKDLASAESLARMLAASRASAVLEISDYLAGMYIYGWERLSKFWEDQEAIENLLQRICQISPQRWHQWIEFYANVREQGDLAKPDRPFGSKKTERSDGQILEPSSDLKGILKRAEEIAPHHDSYEGRSIPILTSECVLLCIANSSSSEIGRKLRDAGLDLPGLEQAARNPRHAPLHGGPDRPGSAR
ncbi:MAG: hypothetical protein WB780_09370 [Candidatus Acidiferrales bacterium]